MNVPAVVQTTWSMIAHIATDGPLSHSHSDRLMTWVSASAAGGSVAAPQPEPVTDEVDQPARVGEPRRARRCRTATGTG